MSSAEVVPVRNATAVAGGRRRGAAPRIDGTRLLNRLDRLAEIGRSEDGGVTRTGFSEIGRAHV